MAARAVSTGSLSFGLVNVPIKLYSTGKGRASTVSFHWLHGECGTRVKQQYYCPKDDRAVARDELVRGYEVSKGKYVPLTEEEIEETKIKARDSIDILSFVPTESVDPLFLEHSYYLGPDKGGAKGYSVLVEAMRKSNRVAIGRYAARGDEHIVSVRADGDLLVMHQMRYADEVRAPDEVPVEKQRVSEKELALALKLIEQTAEEEFDMAAFEDEAKAKKKQLIARKTAAGDVMEDELAEPGDGKGKRGNGPRRRQDERRPQAGQAGHHARPDARWTRCVRPGVTGLTGRILWPFRSPRGDDTRNEITFISAPDPK
jgi:DNA end-binding protein Ku